MKTLYRTFCILVLTVMLTACDGSPATSTPAAEPSEIPTDMAVDSTSLYTQYPITITDCGGHTTTYTEAPKTPITLDPQSYEMMFWMGLGQNQIAAGPQPQPAVPDQFKDQTSSVTVLQKDEGANYVSKEVLLAAAPDFIYGAYTSGFDGDIMFSEEEWAAKGVNAYWSFSGGGCIDDDPGAPRINLDPVFRDIENLGKIFDVQEQANRLIAQMKADLETAMKSVGTGEKLRVGTFEPGEYTGGDTWVYGPTSQPNAIITLAGGMNAFGGIQEAYMQTNWEEYIKQDPEVILIIAYPAAVPQAWDDGEKLLSEMPALQNVSAIKNKRFVRLTFPEMGFGGVRNVDAVKKLAEALAGTSGGMSGMPMHTQYPITITGCGGHSSTFTEAPKTTITMDSDAFELMFWLGIGDRQIGPGIPWEDAPLQFVDGYANAKMLDKPADTTYPSKESLIAAQPDFVYGAYASGFNGDTTFSEEEWAAKGINTYYSFMVGTGCKGEDGSKPRTNFDSLYLDIENLGKIFDTQDQSQALIAQMKSDTAAASASTASGTKLRVGTFEYDEYQSGTLYSWGTTTTVNAIISLAGGENIFADTTAVDTTNWEEIIKRDPEVILIIVYNRFNEGTTEERWTKAEELLLSLPALSNVSAIKNKRFVHVLWPEVGAGGVQSVSGVVKLGKALAEFSKSQ